MADLSVTFLGGLNKIGRNCMVLEYNKRLVVIDCGIMFPEVDMLGIDYILPDINYLYDRKDQVDGIVITHAHEDHAGALQFLLREVDAPIYSSPLSLKLLSRRLDEAGMLKKTKLIEVNDGETKKIGPFDVEFIPVTHSVPHAFAAAYSCEAGTIFHTGDFKIDHSPVDGRRTDLARIGEIGSSKDVVLLLSDSTGAERGGTCGSESTIRPAMDQIFHEHDHQRVIISTFASHIHRIIQLVDSAITYGRKVSFLGRSLQGNMSIARELGMLGFGEKHFIDIEDVDKFPDEQVCVICTGSQGEPLSALSLIASGQSRFIDVSERDCIVLSSHTIPGNETGVNRIINGLMRKGADVIHDGSAPIHVSGHANADELSTMIALTKPKYFIPVHGEQRHMKAHAEIALRSGMGDEHVFICHDGDGVTISDKGVEIDHEAAQSTYLYVDGNVGGITNALLRDRRELGADGLVVVVVTVDEHDGTILGEIEVVTRGWVPRAHVDDYVTATQKSVREHLEAALTAGERDINAFKTIIRRAAGAATSDTTGRRPTVLPLVLEI
jgi:ribonuclease J